MHDNTTNLNILNYWVLFKEVCVEYNKLNSTERMIHFGQTILPFILQYDHIFFRFGSVFVKKKTAAGGWCKQALLSFQRDECMCVHARLLASVVEDNRPPPPPSHACEGAAVAAAAAHC
jgi:hypothetical protein